MPGLCFEFSIVAGFAVKVTFFPPKSQASNHILSRCSCSTVMVSPLRVNRLEMRRQGQTIHVDETRKTWLNREEG